VTITAHEALERLREGNRVCGGYPDTLEPLERPTTGFPPLSADPVERGVTGQASFWLSELGEVRRNWETSAGPNDPVYRAAGRRPPSS
jgi:hypothetical protein